jgi:serine/threonine protein kinase
MSTTPDDDDERTLIRPVSGSPATEAIQPQGNASSRRGAAHEDDDSLALPAGTLLAEFELIEKIGEGGFSIVYLAHDQSLGRKVALKEYMPSSIAGRKAQTQVSPRSERHRDTYEAGLKSFINEAKLLAHFDHGSLVKVYRFWEANGTAYMVMPLYEGLTLRDTVRAMPQPPDEAWLMRMLAPLTEALSVIHADRCYHRDIAPDNVILLAGSRRPLLLDFGAARRVIGDMTQALTVILKPGYAPVEQYAESPDMKQGPWTDVYALAATVYWCITGKTPPPAVGRMLGDSYQPLVQTAQGRYSEAFLLAVDRALAVRPEVRTQTMDALRQDLGLPPSASAHHADDDLGPTIAGLPATQTTQQQATLQPTAQAGVSLGATLPDVQTTPAAANAKPWALIGGGVLALGLAAVAWVWSQRAHEPRVAPGAPAAVPAPVQTPPPSPVEKPVPAAEPVPAPQPAQVPTAVRPAPLKPPRAAAVAPEPATTGSKPAKSLKKASASPECASILQAVSLGDASPELLQRLKTLNCP